MIDHGRGQLPVLAALSIPLFMLVSCITPAAKQPVSLIGVHTTSAAYPWLPSFYACAPESIAIRLADPSSADVELRLGAPAHLVSPAFQIGADDVLVVAQPQTGLASLTVEQVRAVFSGETRNWGDLGGADLPVQVWTYSPDDDLQSYFNSVVLGGRPVASMARLAVSDQEMSDSVGSVPGSVGLLPRRWKSANTTEVLKLATLPVLAILKAEPAGAIEDLLRCLQSTVQPGT
jgi:hypothetical protein